MTTGCVEWAAAGAAAAGHAASGDECCVRLLGHSVLVAAVDGLGHGPDAAAAARLTVSLLQSASTENLFALVHDCHRRLRGTRGLVMSLAMIDSRHDTMAWIGVGNVAGTLWTSQSPSPVTLLQRGGVVGAALPDLSAAVVPVATGDTLVLATDGVAGDYGREIRRGRSPQEMANRILAGHRNDADDALVLVAQYRGGGS